MKILLLSRYDRLGASSRLRTLQFLPYLCAEGGDVDVAPFFQDDYLQKLYSGEATVMAAMVAFAKRFRQLFFCEKPDLLWIEKEALPWVPWALEHALLPRHVPIVSDYDDAVFHRYDLHPNPILRGLLRHKIDGVMAASALVLAGNAFLAERARAAGAPWIEIMPTVVDTQAYATSALADDRPMRTIGWIGTPNTWGSYMAPMQPLLTRIAGDHGARLMAVGAGRATQPHPLLDVVPWSEEREIVDIQAMDIGIMPLDDSLWSRGKCGYKLIQYMACGLPVIASPVGVNTEIVKHGVNGFLASSEDEWSQALTTLLRDPALCRRMGEAGRQKVEREYSLQVLGPRLAKMLREVASWKR